MIETVLDRDDLALCHIIIIITISTINITLSQ
jgi:hypothetical protein